MKTILFLLLIASLLGVPSFGFSQKTDEVAEIAIFLGIDCPISQQYMSTLNSIYLKYQKHTSLKWSFVASHRVSRRSLREFRREYQIQFPVHRDDKESTKTKYFKASVTPEVVIIKSREILYKGAIDNWFYHLGRHRVHPTEHYLDDAIQSILRNERPAIGETKAIGCFIQLSEQEKMP